MNPALLIRLRPSTPWRLGPDSGAGLEPSAILHSDSLYSAVSLAFQQLGLLEEWLNATALQAVEPAVRFTSAFPWQRGYLYAPPPAALWPPQQASARVRFKGARLVPTTVIAGLLEGREPSDEQWAVDAPSACLVPSQSRSSSGPFRFHTRSSAAVDRVTAGIAAPHMTNCVQFAPASGLWCAAQFSSQATYAVWAPRLKSAFLLLADTGLGGLKSRGFGRSRVPDFQPGLLAELLFGPKPPEARGDAYWLLSLVSPGAGDEIRWPEGQYSLTVRSGRAATTGQTKLASRLVEEGSVVVSSKPLVGCARDVAPAGSPHPIYRAGFAVALPIPWPVTA